MATAIPVISFENELPYDVNIYDSYTTTTETDAEKNYFGVLTLLGTVPAHSTCTVQPIHTTTAFVVENASDSKPIMRCTKMSFQKITSFTIAQTDEDAMTQTFKFIDFITHNPDDTLTKTFNQLLTDNAAKLLGPINDFFAKQPDYNTCNFQNYMMAVLYTSQHPETIAKPKTEAVYSLSTLVKYLGVNWPDGIPDLVVSNFTCEDINDVTTIRMDIDLSKLPLESDQISENVATVLGDNKLVNVELQINLVPGLAVFGTKLILQPDTLHIPLGSATLTITKPKVEVDITPLFKFAVVTFSGVIPFNINGKQFDADVSLTIDNVEANVGVVIAGDNTSLPAPPLMKGIHFDEFGVGLSVFFTPPGFGFGLQGKFHIGDPAAGTLVELNDDTFAMICQMEGEIPVPVYASFYVPKMDVNQVVTIFTNSSPKIDVPVNFTDLSFRWADNLMEPLVLPDGTLTQMSYGFSAGINVLSFAFYGDVELDMTNGLTANVQMSPLSFHDVFSMSGNGTGVTIKVDANGNPIKNNQIKDPDTLKKALASAVDKQLVAPGGPALAINTFTSPFLLVNATVSLFDLANYHIQAEIDKTGIQFELDYGSILTEKMSCTLSDWHNLAASFAFNLNRNINLPTIAGMRLGYIHVVASLETHLGIQTSLSDVVASIGGSFQFANVHRNFGNYTVDAHIKKLTDFLAALGDKIEQDAAAVFGDFINDAQKWANDIKSGAITMIDKVGPVLKNAFKKGKSDVAAIMKNAGYAASEVVNGLRDAYNVGANEAASIMQSIGYGLDDLSSGIQSGFQLADKDLAAVLNSAGYAANQAAGELQRIFGSTQNQAASALKSAGYAADQVASALSTVYGLGAKEVASAMEAAGYAEDTIKNTFKQLGGDFANFASGIWDKISGLFS